MVTLPFYIVPQSRSMEDALRKRDIPTAFMVDCLLPGKK
jgi:hypothetical protein